MDSTGASTSRPRRRSSRDDDGSIPQQRRITSLNRQLSDDESTSDISKVSQIFLEGIDKIMTKFGNTKSTGEITVSASKDIIAEFDPLVNDIESWLHAVDEFALIYDWSDRVTSHMALSKLRGAAQTWYQGLPTRIFSWSEWKIMLLEYFQPKRDLHTAMCEMLQYKPNPEQSLYEYTFAKLTLIHKMKLPLKDSDKVNLIMGGIDDPQIKFSVETAGIKDPAILARHLRTIQFGTKKKRI